MIFITLGSQRFQFNRLLIEIDKLIDEGKIIEEVFAQIGYSNYEPKNYKFKKFLDRDEFSNIMNECKTVITHGGTGAIIGAVKREKKVIAIPRLAKFGEHVDDHQLQIVEEFDKLGFITGIVEIKDILFSLRTIGEKEFKNYKSNTHNIINLIDEFIQK